MDFKDVLSKIDAAIGPQTLTLKSQAEAAAYVTDQITKAKAESEKDAEKAKKRLASLRKVVEQISKASWEPDGGQSNPITIPVYDEGVEQPTTMPTLEEQKTPPPGNQGTQADVGFANGGGATGYGDAKSTGNGGGGGGVPAPGATAADGQSYAASGGASGYGDAKSIGKAIDDLEASIGKTATNKSEAFAWPSDLTDKTFLKEGVTKRAEEWGLDTEKAKV